MEDIEHRPISIPKATIDLLLKQDEPAGLIALYTFYYYTAIWQLTNQPKATTSYAAKGLKISETRVRRYKKVLRKLHLIKEVIKRDAQHKITGYFIRVRYYAKASVAVSQRVASGDINAYNNNSKYLVAKNHDKLITKKGKKEKPSFDDRCAQKLEKMLRKKRLLNKMSRPGSWSAHFSEFRRKNNITKKRMKKLLSWYIDHFGEKYVPKAFFANMFCEKFMQIEDAYERFMEHVNGGGALKIVETCDDEEIINEDDGPFDMEGLFDDD